MVGLVDTAPYVELHKDKRLETLHRQRWQVDEFVACAFYLSCIGPAGFIFTILFAHQVLYKTSFGIYAYYIIVSTDM